MSKPFLSESNIKEDVIKHGIRYCEATEHANNSVTYLGMGSVFHLCSSPNSNGQDNRQTTQNKGRRYIQLV